MDQDIQEINLLLVNEHEPERFHAETKHDEVPQAMKALVQS